MRLRFKRHKLTSVGASEKLSSKFIENAGIRDGGSYKPRDTKIEKQPDITVGRNRVPQSINKSNETRY